MMERKRKLEAAKAKGLRSKQLAEGEDADATIAKMNRDIELANCLVCVVIHSHQSDCVSPLVILSVLLCV